MKNKNTGKTAEEIAEFEARKKSLIAGMQAEVNKNERRKKMLLDQINSYTEGKQVVLINIDYDKVDRILKQYQNK